MPRTAAERMQDIATRKTPSEDKAKLWIHDNWSVREVWRVPVDTLVLNVDNRRFAAERLWAEELLGRSLDPENNPDDEHSIESLLLDKSHHVVDGLIVGTPSKDYESLRKDWLRRGQEFAFWIRPDGTVRNGNRRLAMIKRLQRDGDTGLTRVDAVILDPSEIDEADLLDMEQREQLTENFKVRYDNINYLLALKEAAEVRDIDFFDQDSIGRVAGMLQTTVEKSEPEVLRDLFAIKYMDLFLEDSGQKGQYQTIVRKKLELFRDIGRMMMRVESDYPDDFDRVLQVLFAGVRAGKKYEDIRQVRQMFREDRQRFDTLAEGVSTAEKEVLSETAPTLASPVETSPDESDDDENDEGGDGADVINYPPTIGRMIDVAIDGFQASRQHDVLKTLREVTNRLATLADGERLQYAAADAAEGPDIREALREVVRWADEHRGILDDEG